MGASLNLQRERSHKNVVYDPPDQLHLDQRSAEHDW